MDEIAKLKSLIQEYENSYTPLTKPKKDKTVDKKSIEVKPEEQELPAPVPSVPVPLPVQEVKQVQEEVKKEKKKRIKTPAQIEALKKAQEVRKANIAKGKKQKEYESALKLLEYLEIQKEQTKSKPTSQPTPKPTKPTKQYNEKKDPESESEPDEEIYQPVQRSREMKSMKNKKYNFFAD
jgi:hypothetical protein